jgi:hypothetical protein
VANGEAPHLGLERAVGIALRTVHLVAMALVLGGAAYGATPEALRTWLAATALSGVALVVSEARHSRHWVYQARGILVVLHVVALGAYRLGGGAGALAAALVVGAVGSHLPRSVRKWSARHRAVVE